MIFSFYEKFSLVFCVEFSVVFFDVRVVDAPCDNGHFVGIFLSSILFYSFSEVKLSSDITSMVVLLLAFSVVFFSLIEEEN